MSPSSPSSPTQEDCPVLLFQGDSITDAGRQRGGGPNRPNGLGSGYATLAASALLNEQPTRNWYCYNRGVGGDKVNDLAARWKEDCLALEPDVLSILVGINDLWYTLSGDDDGSPERYEEQYRTLIDRTCTALPDVTLLIGEPFFLPGGSSVSESWRAALEPYQAAAHRITTDYSATWIPYQSAFDDALEDAPGPYWAEDGVHPTPAGHYRMAQAWLTAFRNRG